MKRIGEDVAEKLDYQPGVFSVERHVRRKWACVKCQTLIQTPVAVHVIDKGIPTTGLLAQVSVYANIGCSTPANRDGQQLAGCDPMTLQVAFPQSVEAV